MKSRAIILRLSGLVLSFSCWLSASAQDQYLEYVPDAGTELYQIRLGVSDDLQVDLVTPINRLGNPICLDRGSEFKIRFVDLRPEVNQWVVISARLYSAVTGETYWESTTPTAPMAEGTVWPPAPIPVPWFIEYAKFDIEVAATRGPDGSGDGVVDEPVDCGGSDEVIAPPPIVGSNDVFVVWQHPAEHMDIAWVNILKWSCAAGHRKDGMNAQGALTMREWIDFDYDYSRLWHTIPNPSGADEEVFYPRAFLKDLTGQCDDFADFLALAMQSLGLNGRPNRTYPFLVSGLLPGGWNLQTNTFIPAGSAGFRAELFAYHQIVADYGLLFDGAIAYEFSSENNVWISPMYLTESAYNGAVVDYYWKDTDHDGNVDENEKVYYGDPNCPWDPKEVLLILFTGLYTAPPN